MAAALLDECIELQAQEVEVVQVRGPAPPSPLMEQSTETIKAIWPDALTSIAPGEYKLQAPVDLGSSTTVRVQNATDASTSAVQISQLPALVLSFKVPATYPLEQPPDLYGVYATYDWLAPAALAQVQARLTNLWNPGDGVLDAWLEWIRGGDMLRTLGLSGPAGVMYVWPPGTRGQKNQIHGFHQVATRIVPS
jgi:hypothetical protein